jgi:cytochrome c peroxidase
VQLEHAFKTPTLRNINQRAPYMHDGSLPTLEAVIDHYDHGFVERASLDPQMHALHLSAGEKADLLAFLNTLTSADDPAIVPVLPQ